MQFNSTIYNFLERPKNPFPETPDQLQNIYSKHITRGGQFFMATILGPFLVRQHQHH